MKKVDEFGYAVDRGREYRYANNHGYFWMPCAVCGFERGGHESKGEPSIPIAGSRNVWHMVCRRHPDARKVYVYHPAHVQLIGGDDA